MGAVKKISGIILALIANCENNAHGNANHRPKGEEENHHTRAAQRLKETHGRTSYFVLRCLEASRPLVARQAFSSKPLAIQSSRIFWIAA